MASSEKDLAGRAADGSVLGDRYELGRIIGAGGMGRVHEGRDRVLDRSVAVKVLDGARAGNPRFVESFRREARAAAALHHPNVVSVFDSGSEDGLHYIVMERIRGRTLSQVLDAEGPLEPARAASIAAEIAGALAAAHERGLVHRDIKPGNVMLTDDGSVKVMDFGIARPVDEQRATQSLVLGTVPYLAPEQAQGKQVGPPGDVYALGCVLYEMLTGGPPFEGPTPVATAYLHVHEPPLPPSDLAPAIPGALEQVVLRCLAKHPRRRFRHGRQLQAALKAASEEGSAEPAQLDPSTQPLPAIPGRRLPVGVVGLGAILLLLSLLLAPAFLSSRPQVPSGQAEAATPVEVPHVVGMTQAEAAETLMGLGLAPRLPKDVEDPDPDAIVVSQHPAPGERVDRGSVVKLRLSAPERQEPAAAGSGEGRASGAGQEPAEEGKAKQERSGGDEQPSDGAGGEGQPAPSPSPSPSPSPEPSPSPSPSPETSPSPEAKSGAGALFA